MTGYRGAGPDLDQTPITQTAGGAVACVSKDFKTRPVCNAIGVRKAPRAAGRAGFIRIDSVHQGDLDGIKGVYHITCVD